MKYRFFAIPIVAAAVIGWAAPRVLADEPRMARGAITAIAGESLTLKVKDQEMKFGVDGTTRVEATGGSTKTRAAQAAGKKGPMLTELLHTGQAVEVSYNGADGAWHATNIRTITKLSDGNEPESANGVVKSLSNSADRTARRSSRRRLQSIPPPR